MLVTVHQHKYELGNTVYRKRLKYIIFPYVSHRCRKEDYLSSQIRYLSVR